MDILITVILVGFAVSFVVETLTNLTEVFLSARLLRHLLTAPLAFLGCWQLGYFGVTLVVAALAAGFFSLATSRLVNKSANVATQVINRR